MIKNTRISSPFVCISLLLFAFHINALETEQEPDQERQQELIHLLKQDCGSCHGMTLKGGLGPALLPENLIDKPDYILENTIKYGRETLAMPAWDGILNAADIKWLVAQLKEGIEE